MESKIYSEFVKQCSPIWVQNIAEGDKEQNVNIIWAVNELAAEAGECLSLAVKSFRKVQPVDKDKLWEELGDTMWGIQAVLNEAFPESSLEELMTSNMMKLNHRMANQVLPG